VLPGTRPCALHIAGDPGKLLGAVSLTRGCHGFGDAGSRLVVLSGVPFGVPGSTNLLHVVTLSGNERELPR